MPTAYVLGYTSAIRTRPPQSLRTIPSSPATRACAFFLRRQDIRSVYHAQEARPRPGRHTGQDENLGRRRQPPPRPYLVEAAANDALDTHDLDIDAPRAWPIQFGEQNRLKAAQ